MLHHAPSCRSVRIKWFLEELNVPYESQCYNYYNVDGVRPEYLKINPIATSPALENGDLILIESGAMINYILRRYGNGRFQAPEESREQAMVDQWMFWSEGVLAIYQRYFWDHLAPPPACVIDPNSERW